MPYKKHERCSWCGKPVVLESKVIHKESVYHRSCLGSKLLKESRAEYIRKLTEKERA